MNGEGKTGVKRTGFNHFDRRFICSKKNTL
jgi:hypothetical protein